jgi:hypothetical protein
VHACQTLAFKCGWKWILMSRPGNDPTRRKTNINILLRLFERNLFFTASLAVSLSLSHKQYASYLVTSIKATALLRFTNKPCTLAGSEPGSSVPQADAKIRCDKWALAYLCMYANEQFCEKAEAHAHVYQTSMKFSTQIRSSLPKFEVSTQVKCFLSNYEIMTQLRSLIPKHLTFYPSLKVSI